jgi:Ni/Co efflux regulator RcnB
MMRRAISSVLAIALSGCAAPVAKQYYAACMDAGHSESECRMRALEVNQRAWATAGASLQQAGHSMQQAKPSAWVPGPDTSITCRSIHAGVSTTTTCN